MFLHRGKLAKKHKNTHICRILPKLQHTRFIGQFWLEKILLPDNFFFCSPGCCLWSCQSETDLNWLKNQVKVVGKGKSWLV